MNRILRIFILLSIFYSCSVIAQDFWQQTYESIDGTIQLLGINSKCVIFAKTNTGLSKSTDDGESWTEINTTGLPTLQSLAFNSEDHLFAGTWGYDMFRSTDNGDSWTQILLNAATSSCVASIVINSDDDIFAGYAHPAPTTFGVIYRSTDNGDTWQQTDSGITNPFIYSLTINSEDHIFAGTYGNGVYRSTDNGDSWTQVNNGLTNWYINDLAINSEDHIFAGTDPNPMGANMPGGVFRSTDNGESWKQVNNEMDNPDVRSLAINSENHIFARTADQGVYMSTNNGDSWETINSGLSNMSINSLVINSKDYVFAASGCYVYRSTKPTTNVNEMKRHASFSFHLNQNFPNPFNPSTIIGFDLLKASDVTLTIYNVRGEKIETLVREKLKAGHHQYTWNAARFACGVYIYQLKAGAYKQSKKLLLAK